MTSDVAILTPIPLEWTTMCARLTNSKDVPDQRVCAKTGYIAHHNVVCVLSGKGSENTTAALQYTLDNFHPRWVFLVGVAGGFPGEQGRGPRRGDVAISSFVYVVDFGKIVKRRFSHRPELDYAPDQGLLERAQIIADDANQHWLTRLHASRPDGEDVSKSRSHGDCYFITSGFVIDDPDSNFFHTLVKTIPEYHAVDMEGAAAVAIKREQRDRVVGFLMVRGISDEPTSSVDSPGSQQRQSWKPYAADAASAFVEELLHDLPSQRRSLLDFQVLRKYIEHVPSQNETPNNELARSFHRIVPLAWCHITTQCDSHRSLYDVIWPEVSAGISSFNIVCIAGEPLTGKSTLMRRLGHDLKQAGTDVFYVIPERVNPDLWRTLSEQASNMPQAYVLLVDDLFDDEKAFQSFTKYASEANIRGYKALIIATTTRHAPAKRAKSDLLALNLPVNWHDIELSKGDKERIIENSGFDSKSISLTAYESLLASSNFLRFLGYLRELNEGFMQTDIGIRPAETIEAIRLGRLREKNRRVFEAYKYIAFCYRKLLSIPVSLLYRLEDGKFLGIDTRPAYPDFIFSAPDFGANSESVVAAHRALAAVHWDVYVESESPHLIVNQIITSTDLSNWRHRLFLTSLIRTTIGEREINWASIFDEHRNRFDIVISEAGVRDLLLWRDFFYRLHRTKDAEYCNVKSLTRQPKEAVDALAQIPLLADKDPDMAISALDAAHQSYPDNRTITAHYVKFIGKNVKRYQNRLDKLFLDAKVWLKSPGDNWPIIPAYVEYIAMEAVPGVWEDTAEQLRNWLNCNENHHNAAGVWIEYLKLVSQYCGESTIEREIDFALEWLKKHRSNSGYSLLAHYTANCARKLNTERLRAAALTEIMEYLSEHPLSGHLWVTALQLTGVGFGTDEEFDTTILKLLKLIRNMHNPNAVRSLMEKIDERLRNGGSNTLVLSSQRTVAAVKDWLQQHPEDVEARRRFIVFVREWGTDEEVESIARLCSNWLRYHETDQAVRVCYIGLIEKRLPFRLPSVLKQVDKWLLEHPKARHVEDKVKSIKKRLGSVQ